jgi:helicase
MLSPDTVLRLSEALLGEDRDQLTLLDLLLLCTDTPDCEPLIPADFEDLEKLAGALSAEPSTLLSRDKAGRPAHFRSKGRRLLSCVKTALVARAWTRSGDAESVAKEYGCYTFEIRRLSESLERILTAATAVITPPKDGDDEEKQRIPLEEEATLQERVRALTSMVAHGIDEEAVTLTFLPGVGGTLARRLHEVGISSIDDLCIAEPDEVAMVRGVSLERAKKWIEGATEMIKTRSAFAFREMRSEEYVESSSANWPSIVDPYRFRRSLELKVTLQRRYQYEVSGGLEPHRIIAHPERPIQCDCADFAKGNHCKHLLAVRLHRKEPDLLELRERLQSTPGTTKGLDVFQLWFEGR